MARIATHELVTRARLVSGIILMVFVATHLLNHALGLVSIPTMEMVRDVRVAITRSLPGTAILLTASLVHLILGIGKFLTRRSWKMKPVEAVQLGFGLLIPLLLFRHILGTRIAHEVYGVNDNYVYALFVMWPGYVWSQLGLITLAWVHGSIGFYFWLRLKRWFTPLQPYLLGVAILVPVLAFAGFSVGGRVVRTLYEFESTIGAAQIARLLGWVDYSIGGYAVLLALMVSFRLLQALWQRYRQAISVDYFNGPTIRAPAGPTLLETSIAHDIPHASICGGKARCSTCRVRVLTGLENQPAASETETKVLNRIGAMENVRLACQLRPAADLSIVPLLPAQRIAASDVRALDKYFWGVEQKVTLLFADIRSFTKMSEDQLPYDVVFVLNQYLGSMSEVIEDAGGYVDKFMGDGIMAIFGMDRPVSEGAAGALKAARAMSGVLDGLNMSLHQELPGRLNIGIGIHTGEAILGRIGVASGSGAGDRITALGDTVNTASRLETASKDLAAQLVVSAETLKLAGVDCGRENEHAISVKGKTRPVRVHTWKKATKLDI